MQVSFEYCCRFGSSETVTEMECGGRVFIRDPPLWREVGGGGIGQRRLYYGEFRVWVKVPLPPQAALECSRPHRVVPCWANMVGSLDSCLIGYSIRAVPQQVSSWAR